MKIKPMLLMMKLFFMSLTKYRKELSRQSKWINNFIAKKGYSVNKDPMFNTNLKLWLAEAEDTFGKRVCPCFSPTLDAEMDRKLVCPCEFLDEDIAMKGTCHCTLFAAGSTEKSLYKESMNRLMSEYQQPMLKNKRGEIDIRNYPIDEVRGLRVPDAYHIIKRAVHMEKLPFTMFVEYEYEYDSLKKWAAKNGYKVTSEPMDNGYTVTVNRST